MKKTIKKSNQQVFIISKEVFERMTADYGWKKSTAKTWRGVVECEVNTTWTEFFANYNLFYKTLMNELKNGVKEKFKDGKFFIGDDEEWYVSYIYNNGKWQLYEGYNQRFGDFVA